MDRNGLSHAGLRILLGIARGVVVRVVADLLARVAGHGASPSLRHAVLLRIAPIIGPGAGHGVRTAGARGVDAHAGLLHRLGRVPIPSASSSVVPMARFMPSRS